MKRTSLYMVLFVTVIFGSCTKDLENRFNNPDKLGSGVTDIVPGLFTSSITNNKLLIQDYGEWYYLMNDGLGPISYEQLTQRYISYRYDWFSAYNDLTTGNGFDDFAITSQGYFDASYIRLKNWESIGMEVAARSGQDKLDADVYYKLLNVVRLYQASKLVDFFNSVPYFNAFKGQTSGDAGYYPQYDDPKAIYESVITELGNMVDSIPMAYQQMSSIGQQILAQQDVVFKGDASKWQQFANAIRLRLLVRLAGVDASFAKPLIVETLAKPLPTTDLQFYMWYDTDQKSGGGFWMRGLYENSYASFIPNIIMKRLNYGAQTYDVGLDDPRLPVLAMPTDHGDYRGVSLNIDVQDPIYNGGDKYYPYADDLNSALTQNAFSMYNFATFTRNDKMPVYMFTLGELDLLKAEIELKGLASTGEAAEDHIHDAVVNSTNWWYSINQNSDFKDDPDAEGAAAPLYPTKPAANVISDWGDTVKAKFVAAGSVDDKMEVLMQQKFIHLNIMLPYECWSELRRTGHPKLEPFTWHGTMWTPFPERVRYPSDEQQNNTTNFAKVASENNMTSKIFWVPSDRNPNLYWSDYNYK
ncbi:MAG TPA: SusD/RagB family nutrient-binding outer membrane lipoprotein [Puia sp.]|nr:SusD/RagB family nutrient-binding outer membrane lipoprotein [Puia sp.]